MPGKCSFVAVVTSTVLVLACPLSHGGTPAAYAISDNTTGAILDGVNLQKKLQIGSLTKVASAMVVLDWAEARQEDLNSLITAPDAVQTVEGAPGGVGFHPGDRCSMRDLLYAALMQSDNQAAEILALHVGAALGGAPGMAETVFVAQMNALARRLGMRNTRFTNPHGLDGKERTLPYSTAADLAALTRYALERSSFLFYVSQKERRITVESAAGGSGSSYLLRNTNELLGIEKIDGVKTGTTRRAGECLIISAAKPPESTQKGEQVVITPRRLDVIVLDCPDRFTVARQLLDHGWQLYDKWAADGRPEKGWKPH